MRMNELEQVLNKTELGKPTLMPERYSPSYLFGVARHIQRNAIGITRPIFYGFDIWNAYELTWLDRRGKPHAAMAQITVPCDSPRLIESKSLKMYLNSLSQASFNNKAQLVQTLERVLSACTQSAVQVDCKELHQLSSIVLRPFQGVCLDALDVSCQHYQIMTDTLQTAVDSVSETLQSNLFRFICHLTKQPDSASVQIQYSGKKIKHDGLLQYLISYRRHDSFIEQCVERIFYDILIHCKPEKLTIKANTARRGGIDINPCRSLSTKTLKRAQRLLQQ